MSLSKFTLIRQKLHLDRRPWVQFPSDLLHTIFDRRDFVLFNKLELLGDRLLEVISTDLLLDGGAIASRISKIKHELVRNSTFICFFLETDLCQYVYYSDQSILKNCADSFEALVGALYHYQRNIKNNPSAFSLVESYVKKWWLTTDRVNHVLSGQRIDDCQYHGKDIREHPLSTAYVPTHPIDFDLDQNPSPINNTSEDMKDSLPAQVVYNVDRLVKNTDWRLKTIKMIQETKSPYLLLKRIYNQFGVNLEYEILPDLQPKTKLTDLVAFPIDIINMKYDVVIKSGSEINQLIMEIHQEILHSLISQMTEYAQHYAKHS